MVRVEGLLAQFIYPIYFRTSILHDFVLSDNRYIMAKNKIKFLMDEKGITGYRLMKLTGLSYSIIHKLIEAEEIPEKTSWGTLKKIKEALGVESVEDLEEKEE